MLLEADAFGETRVERSKRKRTYREQKDKVPEEFASFSDGNFDSLMRSDAHVSVLRSGPLRVHPDEDQAVPEARRSAQQR